MSGGRDLNPQPSPWEGDILPTELPPHNVNFTLFLQQNTFRWSGKYF